MTTAGVGPSPRGSGVEIPGEQGLALGGRRSVKTRPLLVQTRGTDTSPGVALLSPVEAGQACCSLLSLETCLGMGTRSG